MTLQGREGRPDAPVPVGPPPSKLVVVDLKEGKGPSAKAGDELSVRYFNLAYSGHQIYEDNWRQPYGPFVLGEGQLVEAWEEGLPGIQAGDRWELIVPAGRQTLEGKPEIYVVEAISIVPSKASTASRAAPSTLRVKGTGAKPKLHDPPSPPKHVVFRDLKKGSGARVKPGDQLAARYVGKNSKTGVVQDFWSEQEPYRFRLGANSLGKAWVIGMKGMRLGGRREIVVPSRLAYGDGTMVYVIEPLVIEKRASGHHG